MLKKTAQLAIILVVCLALPVVLPSTVRSKPVVQRFSQAFGYLDVASCILFHPLMDQYSLQAETFSKPPRSAKTEQEVRQEMADRLSEWGQTVKRAKETIEKFQKDIRKLEDKQAELKKELKLELDKARRAYVSKLNSTELDSVALELEQQYNARCEELEAEYFHEIRLLQDSIEAYGEKYEDLKRTVDIILYQRVEEKRDTVKRMVDDIVLVSRIVARKRNISVVFNTTVLWRQNDQKTASWRDIYREQYDYERFKAALFKGWMEPGDLSLEYSQRMKKKEMYLKPFVNTSLLNDMFVVGGADITEDVIRGLLIKYKVSGQKMDKTLSIYRKLSEGYTTGW